MRRALLVVALLAAPALAAEVAGVKVDDRARVDASELVLNGAGLRTKYFLNVYVAGLYLVEKKVTPADILALPGAKRITMRLMRDVSAKQLTDALEVSQLWFFAALPVGGALMILFALPQLWRPVAPR